MGLNRDDVVGIALVLLDERGMDGLTTRSVADRLGVRVSALYRHVRDKRELLAEVADRVLTEVRFPSPCGEDWERQLRDVAHRLRGVLLAHRDGARLFTEYASDLPGTLRLVEGCLGILHGHGVPLPAAAYAGNAVLSFVSGFVLQEQGATGLRRGPAGTPGAPRTRRAPVPGVPRRPAPVPPGPFADLARGTEFPLLSRWTAVRPATQDLAFATGLDHLLAGIRVRLFDDPDPVTA